MVVALVAAAAAVAPAIGATELGQRPAKKAPANAVSARFSSGFTPSAADPRLVIAYDNARAWCSLYANGSIGAVRVHAGAYGSPAMRACLSRKGFVYQSGEAYAYPVRKIAFVTKG